MISIKRDGNNKNKMGKMGKMGKNHGDEVSQVARNQNNKPKWNTKGNSKTEIEYNKTIRIRLIRIFIDYVGGGAQHIGMICDWPVDIG